MSDSKYRAVAVDEDIHLVIVLRAYFSELRTKFVFGGRPIDVDEVFSTSGFLPALCWVVDNRLSMLGRDDVDVPFSVADAKGMLGWQLKISPELNQQNPAYKYLANLAADDFFFENGPKYDQTIDLDPVYSMFISEKHNGAGAYPADRL